MREGWIPFPEKKEKTEPSTIKDRCTSRSLSKKKPFGEETRGDDSKRRLFRKGRKGAGVEEKNAVRRSERGRGPRKRILHVAGEGTKKKKTLLKEGEAHLFSGNSRYRYLAGAQKGSQEPNKKKRENVSDRRLSAPPLQYGGREEDVHSAGERREELRPELVNR